ncbi:UNVERIFIED_CONTAM: hypothetical protein Slati_3508700 [Sesamum latifolium]|uniref:Retrotransposon gag domain-containing protein n=1 Tax=Sesamum latifolium TaxID=2727402 RepID=A0AAW2UJ12_9LAMI
MAENRNKGVAQASDDNSLGQTLQGGVHAFHMQALMSHFEKLLDRKLESLHERLDQVENQVARDGEEYEDLRPRRVNRLRDRARWPREEDGGLGGVKVTTPSFKGKRDLEAYLEWEMRVKQIFSGHNYTENKKVKLTALEFTDNALVWWDQMQKEQIRNGERPITI